MFLYWYLCTSNTDNAIEITIGMILRGCYCNLWVCVFIHPQNTVVSILYPYNQTREYIHVALILKSANNLTILSPYISNFTKKKPTCSFFFSDKFSVFKLVDTYCGGN